MLKKFYEKSLRFIKLGCISKGVSRNFQVTFMSLSHRHKRIDRRVIGMTRLSCFG
jgi:hypothetical protein